LNIYFWHILWRSTFDRINILLAYTMEVNFRPDFKYSDRKLRYIWYTYIYVVYYTTIYLHWTPILYNNYQRDKHQAPSIMHFYKSVLEDE